jgi:hypothetical protein
MYSNSIKSKDQSVPVLIVNLQEGCHESFIGLMKEHGVEYEEMPPDSIMAGIGFVGIHREGNLWASTLTAVIDAFLKDKSSHKVITTTRTMAIMNCEGLSSAEITNILLLAKLLLVVDTDFLY